MLAKILVNYGSVMEGGAVAPGLPGVKDFRGFSIFGSFFPGSFLVEFLRLDLSRVFAPSF